MAAAIEAGEGEDLTAVHWMLEYALAHGLTTFTDPILDFLQERGEVPYHLRKQLELTAMTHGLKRHMRAAEENDGDVGALTVSVLDAFRGDSQFYAVLRELAWQVLLSPLRIGDREERLRVFESYCMHFFEGYELNDDLEPIGDARAVDPLRELSQRHREEMHDAVTHLFTKLAENGDSEEANAVVNALLDKHPVPLFWRKFDKYTAPLRAHLGTPALDRILRDPELRAAFALKDERSFEEQLEEPEWLDSVETFAALHADRATWHAIHEGTDADVHRFLESRKERARLEEMQQTRRHRPRHQPQSAAPRPAPPPQPAHDDELATVRVTVDPHESAPPQQMRGMKRAPARNDDASTAGAEHDGERAAKRSRLAIVSDGAVAAVANTSTAAAAPPTSPSAWQARKVAETILRLGHVLPPASAPAAPPTPATATPATRRPATSSKSAATPQPAPAPVTPAVRARLGTAATAAAETPQHALPAPPRHVDAALRATAPALPATPAPPAGGRRKTDIEETPTPAGSAKKRIPWTQDEVDNLIAGVERFGVGEWAKILATYRFHEKRRHVDLKDKWRNVAEKGAQVRKEALAATPQQRPGRGGGGSGDGAGRRREDADDSIEDDF